jgi:hypothetical protein
VGAASAVGASTWRAAGDASGVGNVYGRSWATIVPDQSGSWATISPSQAGMWVTIVPTQDAGYN